MARLDYPSADLILLRLFFPLISVPFLSLLFLILQTILIVAGSSPTEENKINDILQGLLTCDSKELEGGWSSESFAGEATGETHLYGEIICSRLPRYPTN
jgi:hypothetical protein